MQKGEGDLEVMILLASSYRLIGMAQSCIPDSVKESEWLVHVAQAVNVMSPDTLDALNEW